MTEGGGTGASTRNRRSTLARFGVWWSPTPPPETTHTPKTATASSILGFELSLPGFEGLFRVRDVQRRCYEQSEAAVSVSLSRVLSARETAGDHGAGEEEGGGGAWVRGLRVICDCDAVRG